MSGNTWPNSVRPGSPPVPYDDLFPVKEIVRPAVKGLLTFVPGVRSLLSEVGTGGTDSAAYCYGVWLKHLTFLWESGLRNIPGTVAELGPGDSLGIGLAAMLCGTDNYYALDVVRHSNPDTNVRVLDELVDLFKTRAGRPRKGWPDFDPYLNEDLFPSHILSDELLERALCPERVAEIRGLLQDPGGNQQTLSIRYMVPWSDAGVIEKDSVDVVVSHSVLEHVRDLETTYRALYQWLKPGGMMTHQIDFTSHGLSREWNGYRTYSELLWKIVLGRRSFLINRQPHSVHTGLLTQNGFSLLLDMQNYAPGGIPRSRLSKCWKGISDDDLACSGAFIQAKK